MVYYNSPRVYGHPILKVKGSNRLLYELCNDSGAFSFGHTDPNDTLLGPLRQSPFGSGLIF